MNQDYTEFQKSYLLQLEKDPIVKQLINPKVDDWKEYENNPAEKLYRGPKAFVFRGVDEEIHLHWVGQKRVIRRIHTTDDESVEY